MKTRVKIALIAFAVACGCASTYPYTNGTTPSIHEDPIPDAKLSQMDDEGDSLKILEVRNPTDRPLQFHVVCVGRNHDWLDVTVQPRSAHRLIIREPSRDAHTNSCQLQNFEPVPSEEYTAL